MEDIYVAYSGGKTVLKIDLQNSHNNLVAKIEKCWSSGVVSERLL
jgi:hypothetical protein